MNIHVLLVGRTSTVLGEVRKEIAAQDVALSGATTLDGVRQVLDERPIDAVIMGAGIDLETSDSTTVHTKDFE